MTRITGLELELLVATLNRKLRRPSAPFYFDASGKVINNIGHIFLDHAPAYGGYALREVANQSGGESFYWPRWRRVSADVLEAFLDGQIMALDAIQSVPDENAVSVVQEKK